MANADDVEMADATRSTAPPSIHDVLDRITTGNIDALVSFAPTTISQDVLDASQSGADADLERDLVAPFLPLLTRVNEARRASPTLIASPSPLTTLLTQYDHMNELLAYTSAIKTLTLEDIESYAIESTDATPLSRQFEDADARERVCIVLHLVLALSSGAISNDTLYENEVVRNDIYKPHLVAILVNALATDALLSPTHLNGISLSKVVSFCLAVPLGVELMEAIVLNDPSSIGDVIEVIVESIRLCNPLQPSTTDPVASTGSLPMSSSLLPYALRQAQAACTALAALSPSYATQILYCLRDDVTSIAATFVAFQLLVELPSVRENDHFYATFVFQWLRLSSAFAKSTTASSSSSSPALHVFLLTSLSREGEAPSETQDKPATAAAATFLEEGRYVMSQFRQFLLEDIVQFRLVISGEDNTPRPSRFSFTAMLNALMGLLVIGKLHPEDHETTQLLKLFDRITKEIPQHQPSLSPTNVERMVALMYVLVLLLCSPSTPAFAKMPSQREDSTKLVLQLAQQCIYALYNTKAACPLFILSSVLLYTKSPSLLPCLQSFLGDTFPLVAIASVRVEHLYGVGDAILKPILTENVMAREVVTALAPPTNLSAKNHDAMDEMKLRSVHGLLSEKSFLRHHHGRKLEEWIASLLDNTTTPIHPLLVGVLFEWIENYVMAFEYPIAQRPMLQLAVIPLSPAFVKRALTQTSLMRPVDSASRHTHAKAALVLIYAMQFNQRLRLGSAMPGTKLAAFATGGDGSDPSHVTSSLRNSAEILLAYDLDAYPLKYIWQAVSQSAGLGGLFEFVAPTLARLVAEEYPHLMVELSKPTLHNQHLVRSMVSRKHTLSFVGGAHETKDSLPSVSWASACMWLHECSLAPPVEVEDVVRLCLEALLPLAILSLDSTASSGIGPEAFLAELSEVYDSTIRSGSADPTELDRRLTEALCMPHLVWRHYQQTDAKKKATLVTMPVSPTWLPRVQLLEQPFYILQHAYAGVLASPPLLEVVLGVVTRLRDECIFQLRRRETIAMVAKKTAQATETATNGGTAVSAVLASDPATQQFLMVQDCILVQSMLTLVASSTTRQGNLDECRFILYKAIDALLVETKTGASAASSSPPLTLVIHTQGYNPALVSSLVTHVPSLQQLWVHWMHHPSTETAGASKTSSDRRSSNNSSSSTPSHAATKAIADFVSDSATDKDLIKWQFRVRVFFNLCENYYRAPAHTSAAMYTIKQILNRLRTIAVSSSGSSRGVLHAMSIGDTAARVAFVDAVLTDAIDGCGPHRDLRSEVAQFLLNLKKHVGSSTGQEGTSPKGIEIQADSGQDLERVVARAYQKILQFV